MLYSEVSQPVDLMLNAVDSGSVIDDKQECTVSLDCKAIVTMVCEVGNEHRSTTPTRQKYLYVFGTSRTSGTYSETVLENVKKKDGNSNLDVRWLNQHVTNKLINYDMCIIPDQEQSDVTHHEWFNRRVIRQMLEEDPGRNDYGVPLQREVKHGVSNIKVLVTLKGECTGDEHGKVVLVHEIGVVEVGETVVMSFLCNPNISGMHGNEAAN